MLLTEVTAVPSGALPLQEFKDHLRLGTGFADDTVQDGLAEVYLRAAMAAIEGRIGKAILARGFVMEATGWRDDLAQALPIAPVSAITGLVLKDAAGGVTVVDAARYRLIRDMHRPRIAGVGGGLPGVPMDGTAEVAFTAGFGPTWADVPADLQQAVLMLAAYYHEHRSDAGELGPGTLPFGVVALIARWRTVRVLGGGEA
jgi:uncharacterized phiE125 gp8 family phage protein